MRKINACGLIRRRFCKGNLIDEEFRYTYNIFVRSFCQKPFYEIERNIELAEKCQKLVNEKGATPHRSLPETLAQQVFHFPKYLFSSPSKALP